jgi:hypothetical protein
VILSAIISYRCHHSFRFARRNFRSYTPTMPVGSLTREPGEFNPALDVSDPGLTGSIYLRDSSSLWDQLKGQTTEHAEPPRLEDEGQSGG